MREEFPPGLAKARLTLCDAMTPDELVLELKAGLPLEEQLCRRAGLLAWASCMAVKPQHG